jgi:adenylate cyclase
VALHLGFPDRARQLSNEALEIAQHRGNSFYLAIVHACACCLYDLLRDAPMVLEHSQALIPLAEENPAFTSYATFFAARSLLMANRIEEAKASLRRAIKFDDSTGLKLIRPWELQTEAQFSALEDRLEDALALLTIAMHEAEEVAYSKPPIMLLRADLMARQGARESEVEASYRAALHCAEDQGNRFAELESTTHFARWLGSKDRRTEAHAMLSQIYNWFTEGFDKLALKEAKAPLDQLNPTAISTSDGKDANRSFTNPRSRLIGSKQART